MKAMHVAGRAIIAILSKHSAHIKTHFWADYWKEKNNSQKHGGPPCLFTTPNSGGKLGITTSDKYNKVMRLKLQLVLNFTIIAPQCSGSIPGGGTNPFGGCVSKGIKICQIKTCGATGCGDPYSPE